MQKILIRHLLDAMHCKKNLYENMVRTTFGQKDNYGSRQDMESQGIRRNLWLQPSNNRRDTFHKPEAPYVLNTNCGEYNQRTENSFELRRGNS
jgi:hypothetical protein